MHKSILYIYILNYLREKKWILLWKVYLNFYSWTSLWVFPFKLLLMCFLKYWICSCWLELRWTSKLFLYAWWTPISFTGLELCSFQNNIFNFNLWKKSSYYWEYVTEIDGSADLYIFFSTSMALGTIFVFSSLSYLFSHKFPCICSAAGTEILVASVYYSDYISVYYSDYISVYYSDCFCVLFWTEWEINLFANRPYSLVYFFY